MDSRLASSFSVLLLACGDDGGSSPPPTDSPTDTPGERTITIDIGDKPDSLFAFQDGDGPFQLAPARTGNTITLTIESNRFALVRACSTSARFASVSYRAATETEVAFRCLDGGARAGAITGTITSNVDDSHQLLHGTNIDFETAAETSFTYEFATAGTSDFVAVREPVDGDAIDVFHVERDVAVTGTVTRNLDFSTLAAPLTVAQPVPNNAGSAYTAFMPNPDLYQFSVDTVAPFVHTVLPVNARRSTDRYDVGVIVDLAADSTVQADAVQAVPTAVTAPATNLLDALDIDESNGLSVSWNKVAGTTLSSGSVSDTNGFAFTSFSDAWQATFTGDLTFVVPDLTTVEGYPETGALRTAPDAVEITAVVETGTFPDDGYEAAVFQRSFTPGAPLQPRMRRAIEKTRWQERARRRAR